MLFLMNTERIMRMVTMQTDAWVRKPTRRVNAPFLEPQASFPNMCAPLLLAVC